MKSLRFLCAALCPLLSACATVDQVTKDNWHWLAGNSPDLRVDDLKTYADQDQSLTSYLETLGRTRDDHSTAFVDAGVDYAHTRCLRYLEAAFFFNRVQLTSSREIHTASASASAVLSLVNASKALAGILPLGFNFADQTINNVGQGILYDLDPGTVRELVDQLQTTYKTDNIDGKTFATHAAAMTAIRGYAEQCLPVTIEGAVEKKITAPPVPPSGSTPAPPAPPAPPPSVPPPAGQ